jgi:hypothetical protein
MAPPRLAIMKPAKSPATVLLDSSTATYLPPVLCAACGNAHRADPLRPRGFTLEEFKTAAAQIQELTWDLKTLCQSSTRCPLCLLILECIKECEWYDVSLDADVAVTLEPIGEYQEIGDLTWWMIFTRRRSRRTMKESIRCQLRVGLRSKDSEEAIDRTATGEDRSFSDNSMFPLVSLPERNLDEISQLPSSVSHPKDHPPLNRPKSGFVASNASRSMHFPVREREMSQFGLTKLGRHEVLEPIFTNARAGLDSFFDCCLDEVERSSSSPSSTKALRPIHNDHANTSRSPNRTRMDKLSLSRLSIRQLGRQPRGPVDR